MQTIPDIEVIEHLDFEASLACELAGHALRRYGCDPSEDATFIAVKPCCPHRPLVCASPIDSDSWVSKIQCASCGTFFLPTEIRYLPIGNT